MLLFVWLRKAAHALSFGTLTPLTSEEEYPGAGGHFFCRILKMGLGVVVFSVLVVSPTESFDPIDKRPSESFGTLLSRSESNVKAVTLVPGTGSSINL